MVWLEGIGKESVRSGFEKSVLAFRAWHSRERACLSLEFCIILLPYMSLAHLFGEGLRPAFGNTRDWMRCRGRGGRQRRRRTAASLAVMGAGTCLFAVAPPKCENNGTQRQTEALYSETLSSLERRPGVKRNMQDSNFRCRSPTSAPGPICAGECEGLSLLRFSSRSAVWHAFSAFAQAVMFGSFPQPSI